MLKPGFAADFYFHIFTKRKFLNLAHYFPYDVKLRILAQSRSFLANQRARNAIFGAENLLTANIQLRALRKRFDLKDNNTIARLHLGRTEIVRIFVLGHFLFLEAHSFPRALLSENCSLLETDNVPGQIS